MSAFIRIITSYQSCRMSILNIKAIEIILNFIDIIYLRFIIFFITEIQFNTQ